MALRDEDGINAEAVRVVGEHHARALSALTHRDDGYTLFERHDLDAEAVHAQLRPGVGELGEVVRIGRVPRVTDHDLIEGHAALGQFSCASSPRRWVEPVWTVMGHPYADAPSPRWPNSDPGAWLPKYGGSRS